MKKWLIGLLLVALVVSCSFSISTAYGDIARKDNWRCDDRHDRRDRRGDDRHGDGPRDFHERYDQIREDAKHVINRTTTVIFDAKQAVMRGHRSFGLARAFAAQSRARELYMHQQYREAIFHSLRARDIALSIIRNNRRRVKLEFFPDGIEQRYVRERPRDEELDREYDRRNIGSDDNAINLNIEFNIN
jgi:hypothetical protein